MLALSVSSGQNLDRPMPAVASDPAGGSDSIDPIELADVTDRLARESGFEDVAALLKIARHGRGKNAYLIRFHYLPPGGWEKA